MQEGVIKTNNNTALCEQWLVFQHVPYNLFQYVHRCVVLLHWYLKVHRPAAAKTAHKSCSPTIHCPSLSQVLQPQKRCSSATDRFTAMDATGSFGLLQQNGLRAPAHFFKRTFAHHPTFSSTHSLSMRHKAVSCQAVEAAREAEVSACTVPLHPM